MSGFAGTKRRVRASSPSDDAAATASVCLRTTTRAHKQLFYRNVVVSNVHETQFIIN